MIGAVSKDRWLEAQDAERQVVTYDRDGAIRSARHIFRYLGIGFNHEGKTIAEVGSGPYPAAVFCQLEYAVVFEPLFSKSDNYGMNVIWYQTAFEDFQPEFDADEVWLFNVLQHVRDPDAVVRKAQKVAPVVRFFEPVDYPTCVYHPHTFTEADFREWFGDSVKRYTDRVEGFFDADCVYGTYERNS